MRYIIAMLLTTTSAAWAEVPVVVTDIGPVHSLTAAVMEGLGEPELLLDRGASPHGFQLRPSQAQAVASADLVVWIGPELTPWLDAAVDTRPEGAAQLGLLDAEGTFRQAFGAVGPHNDHAEHEDHDHEAKTAEGAAEEHDGHTHDGHTHDGTDPHAWLDPANGKHWLGLIAAELSRLDPENAATYAANADRARAAIDAADADARALLEPVKAQPYVAFHDAYGYFNGHFGLTPAGTVALGDANSPGARHLAELHASIGSGMVLCIFPEVAHDPALVTQMAEGTGVRVGKALDPAGALLPPGPDAYPGLLRGLAETLADCLKG